MKKETRLLRCGFMVFSMIALSGCTMVDNPTGVESAKKEVVLENFSNTGCKPATEAGEAGESLNTLELTATAKGGVYVVHGDVVLNCGITDYDATIEVDGTKITVTEVGDNSLMAFCNCPIDFGYEIGPLEEGVQYELSIVNKNSQVSNKTVSFVYSPDLHYVEE